MGVGVRVRVRARVVRACVAAAAAERTGGKLCGVDGREVKCLTTRKRCIEVGVFSSPTSPDAVYERHKDENVANEERQGDLTRGSLATWER